MTDARTGVAWIIGWLIVSTTIAGCGPRGAPTSPVAAKALPATPTAKDVSKGSWMQPAELTANDILQRLVATYRQAKSYEDQGVVRLAFRQGGQPVSQEWPVAVAFERPGKLSLTAYQATVKCDGKEFRARIDDPETNHVDGQLVVRPAPQTLQLKDLAADALLYDILSSRLRRQPIQLELLLESGGLVSAFSGDVACNRLDDEQHAGQKCFRVEVPSPGGPFVFWVDQTDFLLRRLDYPAAALVPDLASDPSVSEVQLLADLRGAAINGAIAAGRFTLDVPAAAKRMTAFVIPPRPLPSALFGKQPQEFYFTAVDGGRISSKDLVGKIAILVWYHDNPACEATLQQVSLARQQLKDTPDAAIYAVSTDSSSANNEALQRRLADWKVDLPIVRDLEAFGDKAFKIELQPTIVVLDKQGRVQIFQMGGNPQLADQLASIAERLARGEDVATEVLARHQRERKEYDELVARGGPESGELVELPEAVIRRTSEPKHLRLKPLWTCRDLKAAGNIVSVEDAGRPTRIFVFEGWRAIAEVDAEGQVAARHALDLPEQAAVTFARTVSDKDGKRYFVAAAPLGQQLFLFDENWKLIRPFPTADQDLLQLVDLAFADVGEPDGAPEILAANVGDIGLVALSIAGEVSWRNRAFPNAVSIAITPPDDIGTWAIFATGESGGILRVNRFGKEEQPVTVGNWPILRLFALRKAGAKQAALLALSNNAKGEPFAVGLTAQLKECWNYPLPAGVHQKPIEPIASSHVLPGREGEWWLAGPDGSVHVITEDGELFDSFYTGAALTGLAVTQLGGRLVLLTASDEGLKAWEIGATLPVSNSQSIPSNAPRGIER